MAQKEENPFIKFIKTKFILIVFLIFAFVVLGIFVSRVNILSSEQPVFPAGVRYVQDEIIIKYKLDQSPEGLEARGELDKKQNLLDSLSSIGGISQRKLYEDSGNALGSYYILTLKQGVSIPDTYESLKNIPEIETPSPNYILKIQENPNDPYYPQMWNLKKNNLERAWNTTHSKGILIAVIDTGVDYEHEDLKGVVIKGKNFIFNNDDPMDDQGHGTHVAGILGAVTNNGVGISGVSWGARILAIKACDRDGNCNTSDVSQAIKYAVDNGAKVINISIAGPGSCRGTYSDILSYAQSRGVFVVSAAGNGQNGTGQGVSADNQIPASCENVLGVGSLTINDTSSTFSNYGNRVRIAAPGGQSPCELSSCILSTSLDDKYSLRSGTSMAAPQVSGLAALILSYNSTLTSNEVISCIIRGADNINTQKPVGPKMNTAASLRICAPPKKEIPTPTKKSNPFSISGTVFIDTNNNKKLDTGEKSLSESQVILSGQSSESVVSNSRGKYSFLGLNPGLYSVSLSVGGKNIGDPIDAVLSNAIPALDLNLFVPEGLVSTPKPQQKTASGCFIDPTCLTGKKSFQVCSFQCK